MRMFDSGQKKQRSMQPVDERVGNRGYMTTKAGATTASLCANHLALLVSTDNLVLPHRELNSVSKINVLKYYGSFNLSKLEIA